MLSPHGYKAHNSKSKTMSQTFYINVIAKENDTIIHVLHCITQTFDLRLLIIAVVVNIHVELLASTIIFRVGNVVARL